MRVTVAIVMALVILLAGFYAFSMSSQDVQPTVNNSTNMSQDVLNMTDGIYEGTGNTLATMLPWMGMGAVILVSGGFLVAVHNRGR